MCMYLRMVPLVCEKRLQVVLTCLLDYKEGTFVSNDESPGIRRMGWAYSNSEAPGT
jgi:hypothetical protein